MSSALSWVAAGSLAVLVAAVSCSSESPQQTLCNPGDNIFCRCRGGAAGTKECLADGNSFGPCETATGSCDEVQDPGSGEGGSTVPGGGELPPPAPGELLAPCVADADCGGELGCPMGYCTQPCTSYEQCAPPEPAEPGDCVLLQGQAWCMPYCIVEEHCAPYGPDSHCSYTDEALPPFDVVVCANWGDEIWLPPDGYPPGDVPCGYDEMCSLGWDGTERVCHDGGCTDGCHEQADCVDLEATCTSTGPEVLGSCGIPSAVPGDRCPGYRLDISVAASPLSHQADTSLLPLPSEAKSAAPCAPTTTTAEEFIYEVWPVESGTLIALVTPAPSFDVMLYARSGACTTGPQVACANDELAGGSEIFEVPVVGGEKLSLFVDGYDGSAGAYTLELDLSTP